MWPLGSGFRVLALQVSELSLQPGSHLTLLGSITSSAFNSSPHKFSIYLFILFIQRCVVKSPHTNESSKVLKGVPEQGGSKTRRKTTFVSTLWCWQPFIWHCEKWKIKLFISFFCLFCSWFHTFPVMSFPQPTVAWIIHFFWLLLFRMLFQSSMPPLIIPNIQLFLTISAQQWWNTPEVKFPTNSYLNKQKKEDFL